MRRKRPKDGLPVLFRMARDGRGEEKYLTAVFPTELDAGGDTMTCYAHVGQHGGCSLAWYHWSWAAKPSEYADLLAELRRIYEDTDDEPVTLVVYQRIQPWMLKARRASR